MRVSRFMMWMFIFKEMHHSNYILVKKLGRL